MNVVITKCNYCIITYCFYRRIINNERKCRNVKRKRNI